MSVPTETRDDAQLLRASDHELLESLPPSLRDAIRLRIVDELDYDEVADALGTTESAARVRVHHGLVALRKRLSGPKEDPR